MAEQRERGNPLRSAEFLLVVILVGALLLVLLLIFVFATGADQNATQNSRKDLLAIMLGAFGAWIGAGAAYFFGRENLRAATDSMLKMRGISPQERLARTTLRDLKPKPIPKTFQETDNLGAVLDWFDEDPARFFASVLNSQRRLVATVDEEAIYRYLRAEMNPPAGAAGKSYADVTAVVLKDFIAVFRGEVAKLEDEGKLRAAKATENLIHAAVRLDEGQTAFVASERMDQENKWVTVVVDDKGFPVGYITTADIRRLLLSTT